MMPTSKRVAIIDIGSNSIRLVVYRDSSRAPLSLFNEKVMCGLGRGLAASGRLNPEGREQALVNLARFRVLADHMRVCETLIVATAAVRDAVDGPAFVADMERVTGLKVKVISGQEEARLSALGLLSAIPDADGVVGDLGGGSLELVDVAGGKVGKLTSLPLGALRILDESGGSPRRAANLIKKQLKSLPWIGQLKGRDFYAVGGAWRALARMLMDHRHYPLHIIHNYAVPAEAAAGFFTKIHRLDKDGLKKLPNVSRRRLDALPYAALVFEQLAAVAEPRQIVFSAAGLREGVLFDLLPPSHREIDPLMAGAQALAGPPRFELGYGELLEFVRPLLRADARILRLAEAACRLSDIAWTEHPDYRAAQAYRRVLQLPVNGIDHGGRAFLAYAVALRYGASLTDLPDGTAQLLLSADDLRQAGALGVGLRLGYLLSGGAPGELGQCALTPANGELMLKLPSDGSVVLGDSVYRRLENLGRILDLPTRII
jgi:exopolyphosphatase/guanosine-5'-triphosphate,3'-diphosphate pyrophosphatase